MSHEIRQTSERVVMSEARHAVAEAGFDGFESRTLQAADQFGVERRRANGAAGVERRNVHAPMVQAALVAAELQTQEVAGFPCTQTLDSAGAKALVLEGMRMAGLNHGQVCAFIGNRRGGPYDQSQWTKALDSGDLPLDRMLANLPLSFWRPVIVRLQAWAGMEVDHGDVADIAVEAVGAAFVLVGEKLRRRAG
jgi:hypothetical protein